MGYKIFWSHVVCLTVIERGLIILRYILGWVELTRDVVSELCFLPSIHILVRVILFFGLSF